MHICGPSTVETRIVPELSVVDCEEDSGKVDCGEVPNSVETTTQEEERLTGECSSVTPNQ